MWIAYCAVNLKANRVPYNALENEQMFFVGNKLFSYFPFQNEKPRWFSIFIIMQSL